MSARATWAFARAHPAHFIALGLGTGLSPVAPGTVGTLLAWPAYALLARFLRPWEIAVLSAGLFVVGVWACGRTGRDLGVSDHGGMNWDEFVAFLFVLTFTPQTWLWQGLGLVLFRIFDVLKPPPVSTLDRQVKGGLGVMLDDLAAAGYALLVLGAAKGLFAG
jgi:phosphatidylglycerophosphatase A